MKKQFHILMIVTLLSGAVFAQAPEFAWTKQGAGTLRDYSYSVAVDFNGYVYVTGEFFSTSLTFSGLQLTMPGGSGNCDYFLLKMNPQGTPVWGKTGGGTLTDRGYGVEVDAEGGVRATGHYFGSATFGTYNLASTGNLDVMTMRYDTSGTILWLKEGKSVSQVSTRGLTVDSEGNTIIIGYYGSATVDSVRFDNIKITTNGQRDIFIVKYDPAGNAMWGVTGGGLKSSEQGNSVVTDAAGNVYAVGVFYDTATFSGTTLYGAQAEAFLAKYSPSGQLIWVKGMGGAKADDATGVAVDDDGNVFIAGKFDSAATIGGQNVLSAGGTDAFLAKLNSAGVLQWVKVIGGTGADNMDDVGIDRFGNILAAGSFQNTVTFGTTPVTSNGLADVFFLKYDQAGNLGWFKTAGGNDADRISSFKIDGGGNIIGSGAAKGWFKAGVDSFVTAGVEDVIVLKLGTNPVPVELASFSGNVSGNNVVLDWVTSSEMNNFGFDIERSTDAVTYTKIGFIKGNGTTVERNLYTFRDINPGAGTFYYRLRQVDLSGVYSYYQPVSVEISPVYHFALYDNYPNPFNPSTKISYQLAEKTNVSVKVYDILGNELAQLVNTTQEAGVHSTEFNASGFSSGLYIYTISAGSFVQSKKLMFMK
ncbi:MAG: SBBP repeat-containing protein [Ignavibacteriaceae bacterium]|nr:SBBP repeat-containing protein [Ignavibacteriaceae bacterium]